MKAHGPLPMIVAPTFAATGTANACLQHMVPDARVRVKRAIDGLQQAAGSVPWPRKGIDEGQRVGRGAGAQRWHASLKAMVKAERRYFHEGPHGLHEDALCGGRPVRSDDCLCVGKERDLVACSQWQNPNNSHCMATESL